eukprot:PITA_08471
MTRLPAASSTYYPRLSKRPFLDQKFLHFLEVGHRTQKTFLAEKLHRTRVVVRPFEEEFPICLLPHCKPLLRATYLPPPTLRQPGSALNLLGFTDSDWAGDKIDRKSTSGYSLSLGSGPICWSSKKQAAIALSSAEAKYRGLVNITIQALWLQHFLTELGVQFRQPIVIWCDNQSTLKFSRDLVQRQRTKHIEIHMHYIRDLVHDRVIDLQFCPSAEHTADIFTKTFTEQKFRSLRDRLGVKDIVA